MVFATLWVSPTERPLTTAALIFAQVLLTQWVELKRLEDFKNPGSQADGSFFGITDDFKGVANGCVDVIIHSS